MNTDLKLNVPNVAEAAPQIEKKDQTPALSAPKQNIIRKVFADMGDFFYTHFTKMGRLELKERHAVAKINRLDAKLETMQIMVADIMGKPEFVAKNEGEAKKILAKYNSLLNTHQKATEQLANVRNKLKEIDKAKHGYQRVQEALISIENESKIESNREDGLGVEEYKRLHNSLRALHEEYASVFKKHPKLEQEFARIAKEQLKIVYRAKNNEFKAQENQLTADLNDMTAEKKKLLKKLNPLFDQNDQLKSELNTLNSEKEPIVIEFDSLRKSVASLESDLESEKNAQKNNKIHLKFLKTQKTTKEKEAKEIELNSKKIFFYNKNTSTVTTQLDNLEEDIKKCIIELGNNSDKITSLNERLANQSAQLAIMDKSLETKNSDIALTEKKLKRNENKIDDLKSDIKYFDSEIQVKNQEIAKIQPEIKQLEQLLKPQQVQEIEKNAKLEDINQNNEKIRDNLQLAEQLGLQLSSSEMAQYKAQVEKLEDEYAAL